MRILRAFEVGRAADGSPMVEPATLTGSNRARQSTAQ
jgi:hypothetical protein